MKPMGIMGKKGRLLLKGLLLGAILLQLCLIGWYQYNHYLTGAMMDSDAAAEILLAEHMFDHGEFLLSPTWFYSTEIRVLHSHLIMQPLFFFTRDYNVIAALTSVILAALIALSAWFCIRGTGLSHTKAAAGALVLILPLGIGNFYSYFAYFIACGYYAFFLIASLLMLGFWLRLRNAFGMRRYRYLAVSCLLAVVMGLCGVRYLLVIILPLLLAQLAELLLAEKKEPASTMPGLFRVALRMAPALGVGFAWLMGFCIYHFALLPRYGGNMHESIRLISGTDFRNALTRWVQNIFASTGFLFRGGKLLSVLGIVYILLLLYAVLVLVCAVLMLRRLSCLPAGLQFYVLVAWIAFLVNSGVALFVQDAIVLRYLLLGMFLLLPLPVLYLNGIPLLQLRKTLVVAGLVAAAIGSNLFLLRVYYPYSTGVVQSFGEESYTGHYQGGYYGDRTGYLDYLQTHGYSFGWSGFWQANITTMSTGGTVRMASVLVDTDEFALYEWLMPKEYTNTKSHEPEFILFTTEEYVNRTKKELSPPGETLYQDDSYVIMDTSLLSF